MKTIHSLLLTLLITFGACGKSTGQDYTYFIRQIQLPDQGEWDMTVAQEGNGLSALAINPNGARFELWTVKADPLTSYLLDTTYVNSYIPVAEVSIESEDPYEVMPRTRADRPFRVIVSMNGLSTDPTAPPAAQSVKLLRHEQAYQTNGTGKNTDRGQAKLISEGSISSNGTHVLEYPITQISGTDRLKVRGEERFSVFSLADYQSPEAQLDAVFIQIWPVATSTVSGIQAGDEIKGFVPEVSIDLEDLYPDSWTFAQVYKGSPQLGTNGVLVPGSSIVVDSSVPRNEQLTLRNWDNVLTQDGTWTLEVLTATPFGTDRLAYVSFEVDRSIQVNGVVTSIE
jgi:hypothetical protein